MKQKEIWTARKYFSLIWDSESRNHIQSENDFSDQFSNDIYYPDKLIPLVDKKSSD